MPLHNLEGILSHTLLFAAQPRLTPVDRVPTPPPIETGGDNALLPVEHRPIWEYQGAGLSEVRNVTVVHRNLRFERVKVCNRIAWGPVTLKSKRGKEYELPLTDRFLLRSYWVQDGDVDGGESRYWPLRLDIHHSFQRVFGYEVDLVSGELRPLPKDDETLRNPELFTPIQAPAGGLAPMSLRSGSKLVCRVAPLRIVVCVTFGCTTERKEFEPGGILGAAKLFPVVMVYTNLDVENIETTIVVERPSAAAKCHMDGEEMTPFLKPVLFADRNPVGFVDGALATVPFWDQMFDYYDTSPAAGSSFAAVRRDYNGRSADDIAQVLTMTGYQPRPIQKVARQGEFDNLHIAPRMVAPKAIRRYHPEYGTDQIVMAPFCVHDCFHTHWRWGSGGSQRWVLGWSGSPDDPGNPHETPGAPMVPPNQDVTMTVLPSGFKYVAKAHPVQAGKWQVFFHHGSGYAIDVGFFTEKAVRWSIDLWTPDLPGQGMSAPWSLFYWNLRYENGRPGFKERIKADPGMLRRLRQL